MDGKSVVTRQEEEEDQGHSTMLEQHTQKIYQRIN